MPIEPASIRKFIVGFFRIAMLIALILAIYKQHWKDAFTTSGILLIMFAPHLFNKTHKIQIPPEFELAAIIFAFASLYLGEIHAYYTKYWWWDISLHVSSGVLLGILGFLLVYVLNEHDDVRLNMRPSFVALFAFAFSVAFAGLWEVFEFSMDQLFSMSMQKAMLGDASGLTDTMWDLIVTILAAGCISLLGWRNIKMQRHSIFDRWMK